MTGRNILIVAGVGASLVGSQAQAAPLRKIGVAAEPVVTDARFAVLPLPGTGRPRVRVLDTRRDRERTMRAPLRGCAPAGRAYVGGGQLLWDCRPGGPLPGLLSTGRLRRLDLRTGRIHSVPLGPAAAAFPERTGFGFFGIGARWIAGQSVTPPGPAARLFLDWRTGEVNQATPGPSQVVDLDGPMPVATLCPGLTPTSSALFTYQYAPPFGLGRRPVGLGVPPITSFRVDLELYRCGHRPLRVARCECPNATLAGGVVSWVTGRTAHVYVARTGRRFAWRVSRTGALAASTSNRVFVSLGPTRRNQPWTVFSADL